MYLHEKEQWADFTLDYARICSLVASVRHHQGRVLALFSTLGGVASNHVSKAIMQDRKRYYSLLEVLGHSDGDIKDMVGRGILRQSAAGGRSTNYELT